MIKYFVFGIIIFCNLHANILTKDNAFIFLKADISREVPRKGEIEIEVIFINYGDKDLEFLSPKKRINSGAFKRTAFSSKPGLYLSESIFTEPHNINVVIDRFVLKPGKMKKFKMKLPVNYDHAAELIKISYYVGIDSKIKTAPIVLRFKKLAKAKPDDKKNEKSEKKHPKKIKPSPLYHSCQMGLRQKATK